MHDAPIRWARQLAVALLLLLLGVFAGASLPADPADSARAELAVAVPTATLVQSAAPAFVALPAPIALAGASAPPGSSIPDVAARVLPSVVNISLLRSQGSERVIGGGSGVIVDPAGTILTNHHVVSGGQPLRITLHDGREFGAEVIGSDESSDLAALRLIDPPAGLRSLPFGDSDGLRIGETVLAVGSPWGLRGSVSLGIVSGLGRANGMAIADYQEFIQTDAAINPGNSGGALVNAQGELIGINTAILSSSGGYQGVGFSIPTSLVRPILASLLETGHVERGWLGVRIQDLTPASLEYSKLKLPENLRGVMVRGLIEGSPAAAAGLQPGDVILQVDGRITQTSARLRNTIAHLPVGKAVELEVMRMGKRMSIIVQLGALPTELPR